MQSVSIFNLQTVHFILSHQAFEANREIFFSRESWGFQKTEAEKNCSIKLLFRFKSLLKYCELCPKKVTKARKNKIYYQDRNGNEYSFLLD